MGWFFSTFTNWMFGRFSVGVQIGAPLWAPWNCWRISGRPSGPGGFHFRCFVSSLVAPSTSRLDGCVKKIYTSWHTNLYNDDVFSKKLFQSCLWHMERELPQKSCDATTKQATLRQNEAPLDACGGFSKDWVGGSTWQNKTTQHHLQTWKATKNSRDIA